MSTEATLTKLREAWTRRDVQGVLDDYLAGRIDEAEFLSGSRPWQNYRTGYRPLTIDVVCNSDLKKRPGRFEFQRGVLSQSRVPGRNQIQSSGSSGHRLP